MSHVEIAPQTASQRYVLYMLTETFLMKGVTLHYLPLDERGQPVHDVSSALIAYLTDQAMPSPLAPEATEEQNAEYAKAVAEAKANQWHTKWHADKRPALEKAADFLVARLGLTAA
jgi:hypothetical protein